MPFWSKLLLVLLAFPLAAASASGTTGTSETNGADAEEPLDISSLSDAAESFLPAQISVFVIGVLATIKLAHDNIQAAFKSLPGNSCLFLFGFLGMFCWMVLVILWDLNEGMIDELGIWTTVSSYIATVNLMLTPLLLLIPDQTQAQTLARDIAPTVQEAVQKSYDKHKTKLAVLYLCVMAFQISSVVSVFRLAEIKQAALERGKSQINAAPGASSFGFTNVDDITGPVMATLLYVILSWCSLGVLYERMFPDNSFAADFPLQVLENAFPCLASYVGASSHLADELKLAVSDVQSKADEAQARLTEAGIQVPGELKATQASVVSMSSAFKHLHDSLMQESEGITVQINKLVQLVDSRRCLFYVHYAFYVAYGVGALVLSGWLGTKIVKVVSSDTAAMTYLIIGAAVLCFFFSIICVVAICGGMAPRKARKRPKLKSAEPPSEGQSADIAPKLPALLPGVPALLPGDSASLTYGVSPQYGSPQYTFVAPPTGVPSSGINDWESRFASVKQRITAAFEGQCSMELLESLEKDLDNLYAEAKEFKDNRAKIDEARNQIQTLKLKVQEERITVAELEAQGSMEVPTPVV